ncbi:hypothetical protein A3D14_02635 [Candidatus Saccharibacteria bacterium RIFCSPHIGHO2_02_FULL_47_12]|nr:MAG: hypothetical protein A3D14_02635 [Candidatus Saccharibacteria bacterium RIFCSPHIGHO2_02_FULL_47_12]
MDETTPQPLYLFQDTRTNRGYYVSQDVQNAGIWAGGLRVYRGEVAQDGSSGFLLDEVEEPVITTSVNEEGYVGINFGDELITVDTHSRRHPVTIKRLGSFIKEDLTVLALDEYQVKSGPDGKGVEVDRRLKQ